MFVGYGANSVINEKIWIQILIIVIKFSIYILMCCLISHLQFTRACIILSD